LRTSPSFIFAREAQSRGDFNSAVNILSSALDINPNPGEIALELVRVLLRAGHIKRANEIIEVYDVDKAPAGLRLRFAMERVWINLLLTFDVATAIHEADGLFGAASREKDLALVEKADAQRIRSRILKVAAIYREIDISRAIEATEELSTAANTLLSAGWIDEALNAKLLVCKWQDSPGKQEQCHLELAGEAIEHDRPDIAGEAWLHVAELWLKAQCSIPDFKKALSKARNGFKAASNDLGQIDVDRVETTMRLDQLHAPLSEMEDVLGEYKWFDVPARELIVISDLSVRAHHKGDLEAALRYRESENKIGLSSGLFMTVLSRQFAQADLLMRGRRYNKAIDICSAYLDAPLPRIMRGNFEQFIGTAYSFAGDLDASRRHLMRARKAYDEVGAEDFTSIVITKLVNDTVSNRVLEEIRDDMELARVWAEKDSARADYEGASAKQQLIAQLALQLFRLPHLLQGAPQYLDQAEAALQQANTATTRLDGFHSDREMGNIAQLAGEIAVTRGDKTAALEAYKTSIIQFDRAGLAMQAANSRYVIGCMDLNASADAIRTDMIKRAAKRFGTSKQHFEQALDYYTESGMKHEAARCHYMLARLYTNGRILADPHVAVQMTETAREHLRHAGGSYSQMRHDREMLEGAPGRLWTVDLAEQAGETRDLASSLARGDLEEIWHLHQKNRTVTLNKALAIMATPSPTLIRILQRRPDLRRLYNREQDLLHQIDRAPSAERGIVKVRLGNVREDMSAHDEFSDYLEQVAGRSPSLEKVQDLLAQEPGPPIVLIDWVRVNNRYMLLATRADGLTAQSLQMAPEDVLRLTANWQDWHQLRPSLQSGRDVLRPLDPLIAEIDKLAEPDEHLVLCPSGPLAAIPIHALEITGQPLIARNPVSYAPSIAVVRSLLARRDRARTPRDFVLADPQTSLPPSPESRELGRAVAAQLGVTAIEGEAATRTTALEALQSGDIFHFQGHALFDYRDPTQSKILLSDGDLTASEIIGLNGGINARLVTLGACQSAAMVFAAGDEPVGLPAALLMAGTHSIVAPIWPVDARDAAKFMEAFYGYILGDEPLTYAKALQKTVLVLAGEGGDAPPYKWAAYLLYGDWGGS